MSTDTPRTDEYQCPPIQSAYLNISTAISDAESAIDEWESEKWTNAVMHIDLAIEQLQSAKYKIQTYKQI